MAEALTAAERPPWWRDDGRPDSCDGLRGHAVAGDPAPGHPAPGPPGAPPALDHHQEGVVDTAVATASEVARFVNAVVPQRLPAYLGGAALLVLGVVDPPAGPRRRPRLRGDPALGSRAAGVTSGITSAG